MWDVTQIDLGLFLFHSVGGSKNYTSLYDTFFHPDHNGQRKNVATTWTALDFRASNIFKPRICGKQHPWQNNKKNIKIPVDNMQTLPLIGLNHCATWVPIQPSGLGFRIWMYSKKTPNPGVQSKPPKLFLFPSWESNPITNWMFFSKILLAASQRTDLGFVLDFVLMAFGAAQTRMVKDQEKRLKSNQSQLFQMTSRCRYLTNMISI